MYSYVIRMPLVCTRMPFVCYLYVLVCHPYVTRLWFYHEPFLFTDWQKRAKGMTTCCSNFLTESIIRSSHRRCSVKKAVLKKFADFTGKHLCWNLFLINFQTNFIKKRLQYRCFPVKFAKFLRTPISKNICE